MSRSTTSIPPPLLSWYRNTYPTLQFNQDWLQACCQYLIENDPSSSKSTASLIKNVEIQLLSSDLSTSVVTPLNHFQLFGNDFENDDERDGKSKYKRRKVNHGGGGKEGMKILFSGKGQSTLFQIEQIEDVRHSAQSTMEVLEDKREWRKLRSKGIMGDGIGGRDMNFNDDEEEGEDDKKGEKVEVGKEPKYPRGNGKFVLSDGKNRVRAFELERIGELGLEQVRLGTKLLLQSVPYLNNLLLLTPQNTTVKGYDVEEFEMVGEWRLENCLRRRLDLDPLPPPIEAPPIALEDNPPSPPRQGQRQPPPKQEEDEEDYFNDDDIDLSGEMIDEIEQQYSTGGGKSTREGKGKGNGKAKEIVRMEEEEGFGAEEEMNEGMDEEDWEAMMEIEQQQQQRESITRKAGGKGGGGGKETKKQKVEPSNNQPPPTTTMTTTAPTTAKKTKKKDNQSIEVLEIDSADEGEGGGSSKSTSVGKGLVKKEKSNPVAKKKEGGGKKKKEIVVVELDDSD